MMMLFMKITKSSSNSNNNSNNSNSQLVLFIIIASFFASVIVYSYVSSGFGYPSAASYIGSFRPLNSSIDSCFGKYIFIQHLPRKFNEELINRCDELSYHNKDMCVYLQNNGFGPPVFSNSTGVRGGFRPESWFATDQFTLEVIFHTRMKKYKCLTNDSSSANAIYVPFYAALEAGRNLEKRNITVRDEIPVEFLRYISNLKEWKGFNGSDHFFVAGRIAWDFRRSEDNETLWGNKLMRLPEAERISMLTIEATTFYENENGIPYPTYFHPSSYEEIARWKKIIALKKRDYLFAFVGAPRPWENSIRNEIINQCLAAKNECILISCKDMTDTKCHSPLRVLKLFQSAKFCLQPPGDSPTRRSTFDSIISGCIPVFFDMRSGPEQYKWYFPKNYSEYSVYIPNEDVKGNKTDIRSVLSSISDEEVNAMRSEVIKMIPRIIYANKGSEGGDGMEKDAFDIAVDGILEKVRDLKREIVVEKKKKSTGLPFVFS